MLILEAENITKQYGDRTIFHVDNLKIYDNDRIGIVGLNGAGKTTFVDILSGRLAPDTGTVKLYGKSEYITQLADQIDTGVEPNVDNELARQFGVHDKNTETMSGGERTRLKIAQSLSTHPHIIFADEPTSNLDMKGIALLEQELKYFKGALVIISHDRELLDKLSNKIFEIERGVLKEYSGNYTDYKMQKKAESERQQREYEEYMREKERLTEAVREKEQRAGSMKKTPTRMGNSEARLHKRGVTSKQSKLRKQAKTIESRINQLEVKQKPHKLSRVKIDIPDSDRIYSKVVIKGENICKAFGTRVLLDNVNFEIGKNTKTAIIGDNGSGKTTLLKMIMEGDEGIYIAPGVKIGYFSQELDTLDENKTILENVMKNSIHTPSYARLILARLLFRRDDVYKKVGILSGGERVKVSFASIFLSNFNLLIFDEPTNYLDINSLEALEDVFIEYEGTVLFVSHDRRFINRVSDNILILSEGKISSFKGNYSEYTEHKMERKNKSGDKDRQESKLRLENRLSEILSRLSMPSKNDDIAKLDMEYNEILRELKNLKTD